MNTEKHNLHPEMDKFVHAYLLKEGWEESEFGVISAEFEGGSCNLTYLISKAIEAYLEAAAIPAPLLNVEEAAIESAGGLQGNERHEHIEGFKSGYQAKEQADRPIIQNLLSEITQRDVRLREMEEAILGKSEKGFIWVSGYLIKEIAKLCYEMCEAGHGFTPQDLSGILEDYRTKLW